MKGIIHAVKLGKIAMDATQFATWKYKHEGSGFRSQKQQIAALILFAGALVVHFSFHLLPLSIGLCVIAVLTLLFSAKKIFVGPRYLICGSTILYYNNVVRMALDEASGNLLLGHRPAIKASRCNARISRPMRARPTKSRRTRQPSSPR